MYHYYYFFFTVLVDTSIRIELENIRFTDETVRRIQLNEWLEFFREFCPLELELGKQFTEYVVAIVNTDKSDGHSEDTITSADTIYTTKKSQINSMAN